MTTRYLRLLTLSVALAICGPCAPAFGDEPVSVPLSDGAGLSGVVPGPTATADVSVSTSAVVPSLSAAPVSMSPEVAAIAVVVPMLIAGLKRVAPNIPGGLLPYLATVLGMLIEFGLAKLGYTGGGGLLGGAIAGSAGVGLREKVAQLVGSTGYQAVTGTGKFREGAMLLVGLVGLSSLLVGCTSYRHQRFSDTGQPIESTSLSAPFLTKTALQNLKTSTKEKRGTNTYSRTVGLDGVEARVDTEGVDAVGATVGRLLIEGIKASSGVGALVPSAPPAPRAAAQPAYQAPPPEAAVAPAALRTVAVPAPAPSTAVVVPPAAK